MCTSVSFVNIELIIVLARTKTSPAPAVIPEASTPREVRIIRPNRDHKFSDERLVMVTARRVPFLVCSFIPYTRIQKPSRYLLINSKSSVKYI